MSDTDVRVNLSRQLARRELWLRFCDVLKVMFPGLPRKVRRRQAWTWSSRYAPQTKKLGKIPTADQLYAGIQEVLRKQKETLSNEASNTN